MSFFHILMYYHYLSSFKWIYYNNCWKIIFQDEHENELITAALGSGTNLLREFSKMITDDADKYSLDLNSLYKKYEIAAKTEQARSYLQMQVK